MARVGYAKHSTQVDTDNFPDDGSSPVGSNEWNEAPSTQGMLGFSEQTISSATLRTIASGVATVYDSVTVVTSESSTTDTLQKLAITNTSEYDLIYLFANTGHNITLEHGDLNADGEISTVSGANETLSTTVPTILIRKGAHWYGYGGGGSSTPTDITVADTTDTSCSVGLFESPTGDLAPKSDAGLTYNAGTGVLTATGFAGPITGNVTGNASGTALTVTQASQPAITSIGTLAAPVNMGGQDITNGGVIFLTEQAAAETDVTAKGQIWVDDSAPNRLFFTDDAGTDFDLTAGGGDTIVHEFTNTTTTNYAGTASSFGTVGAGVRDIYIKKIDANNEGVFTKIWKNGSAVEVQIA